MIKVIHNNSCPESRAILEYLDENNIKFQIIDVEKEPLSLFELRTLFKKLNKNPSRILRHSPELYKKHFSDTETIDDEQALKVIAQNPELIECPILIKGKVAMAGHPLENVKFFIED
ncbi:ArsC/Spx/MgsR family protein [Chryseobacterium sp. SC28]|uniref:ArsC/Spx/MgsR family protein n=1 Tax=Chryseobacterium sp. SC28 TaxID=2268028 RepID=UPI000F64538B|nr:ArsC/Spx/MgsR family protein [Chryseobacterium sp. SC28]RRQ46361.1 arsenate reductase (glutaredoxin) [Chryseobacterium sp. SC28]